MKLNEVTLSVWKRVDSVPDQLWKFLHKRHATEYYDPVYTTQHDGVHYYIVHSNNGRYYKDHGHDFIGLYAVFPHTNLGDLHDSSAALKGREQFDALKQKFNNVHGDSSYVNFGPIEDHIRNPNPRINKVSDAKIIRGACWDGTQADMDRIVSQLMRTNLQS